MRNTVVPRLPAYEISSLVHRFAGGRMMCAASSVLGACASGKGARLAAAGTVTLKYNTFHNFFMLYSAPFHNSLLIYGSELRTGL